MQGYKSNEKIAKCTTGKPVWKLSLIWCITCCQKTINSFRIGFDASDSTGTKRIKLARENFDHQVPLEPTRLRISMTDQIERNSDKPKLSKSGI